MMQAASHPGGDAQVSVDFQHAVVAQRQVAGAVREMVGEHPAVPAAESFDDPDRPRCPPAQPWRTAEEAFLDDLLGFPASRPCPFSSRIARWQKAQGSH